jgi:hypothetical protein
MFPRQTKRTETDFGGLESLILLVDRQYRVSAWVSWHVVSWRSALRRWMQLFGQGSEMIDRYATSLTYVALVLPFAQRVDWVFM